MTFEYSGKNLHLVSLASRRCNAWVGWHSPCEFLVEVFRAKLEPSRATINDSSHSGAVALSEYCDSELLSK